MPVGHYENFPVASLLLPAPLRAPVQAIYRFARTADDLADEGDAPAIERLRALDALDAELDAIESGTDSNWPDLAAAVRAHSMPLAPLRDLLSAFRQDVTVHRYADDEALLDYCRRSANPVGRMLLALFRRDEPELLAQSDAICTGLQLVNFWQDVAIDWAKGRIYLPADALCRHGIDEAQIGRSESNDRWQALMAERVSWARGLLSSGAPLPLALGGRVGWELRLVVQGGLRIAEKIDAVRGDVFRHRPVLTKADWAVMSARAFRMTRRPTSR
jgi:squalene synthase HpnC